MRTLAKIPENSEVYRLCGDNRLALKLLNWKPKYVGEEGFNKALEMTAQWFMDKNNLLRYKSDIYNL